MTVLCERTEMAEREEPSELDKLFEALEQMQIPEGFKAEIVEGIIIVSPQRDTHWDITAAVYDQLRTQYPRKQLKSDMRIDFPGYLNGFCPDLAAVGSGAEKDNRGHWRHEDVEFVLEVISRGTAGNDYGKKKKVYAIAGIAVYLIADPYTGQCHLHTRPSDDRFWRQETFAFGEPIELKPHGIDLTLETEDFPRD
ncbi:Uma2 family endonuclease [Streptomyces gobiensis]|uniref:Uma2 family endonuclease n=1 Tax=Streptomyces gobiensis TaxID=2875706 RepID=UPI001E394327|nr:Uma2 family endonuclease [Streptomyces gobiensis]UGY93871.1 Uma2 family endonuclease [Streptomyces gobiensis]